MSTSMSSGDGLMTFPTGEDSCEFHQILSNSKLIENLAFDCYNVIVVDKNI